MMARLHRVEGENINLRIEHDMMKKDVAELNKEKSALKVCLIIVKLKINHSFLYLYVYYCIILLNTFFIKIFIG